VINSNTVVNPEDEAGEEGEEDDEVEVEAQDE